MPWRPLDNEEDWCVRQSQRELCCMKLPVPKGYVRHVWFHLHSILSMTKLWNGEQITGCHGFKVGFTAFRREPEVHEGSLWWWKCFVSWLCGYQCPGCDVLWFCKMIPLVVSGKGSVGSLRVVLGFFLTACVSAVIAKKFLSVLFKNHSQHWPVEMVCSTHLHISFFTEGMIISQHIIRFESKTKNCGNF